MAVKIYKPTTSSRRRMSGIDYRHLSAVPPHRALTTTLVRRSGRNHTGRVTVRHQGAGHKRRYRVIDFKRAVRDVVGRVATIEYDPNRNSFISLVKYQNGAQRYILHCRSLRVGAQVIAGAQVPPQTGNCLPLGQMPEGTLVHNVELHPGYGGQLMRSAGSYAQIVGQDEKHKYTLVRLKSGEVRKLLAACYATVGVVSNEDFNLVKWGKAGRNRWRGKRPTVRGAAMNPADHPHGGGNGKAPVGHKSPLTPWGKPALGLKTRRRRRSNKLIVKKRG